MDNALAVAGSHTLGLLTLITGTSPPRLACELLLPSLDFDMPVAESQSEPSTVRSPPRLVRPQMTDPLPSNGIDVKTPPSTGPGAYDTAVIPPSHGARTLVLCFDGTGDQFDSDVRP